MYTEQSRMVSVDVHKIFYRMIRADEHKIIYND